MTWTEEVQHEIEQNLSRASPEECVAKAVSGLISGHLDAFGLNFGMQCSCDPRQTIDFNERFLCAALEELRRKAVIL